jgi:hypothetical protein
MKSQPAKRKESFIETRKKRKKHYKALLVSTKKEAHLTRQSPKKF